ncbi:MAG TPA: hypothetical protein VGP82_24120 [Ktedonobacterales bacterium]|jgi:hypothetical protein|nr:hypothetical protein [Ktedonobacterales bacterium]
MSYPGGQDPYWQGQQGQNAYPPNPQAPYGQNTSGQNSYGQPAYPQPPYGEPQQYAQQAVATPQRPAEQNPHARSGLIYGAVALGITIVAGFFGYYVVGLFGIYAAYDSIRGLIAGAGLSSHKGMIAATIGLLLGLLSLALTVVFAMGLI